MHKIKLTFCMYQIITGGIESNLLRLLEKLSENPKYEIRVISQKPVVEHHFLDFFKTHNIPLIYDYRALLGQKPNRFIPKIIWKFNRLLPKYQNREALNALINSDVIIDYFNCSFYSDLKNLDVPKIGWYHASIIPFKKNYDSNKRYLKCYDKFICLTDAVKNELTQLEPILSKKILRIYNPVEISEIKNAADNAYAPPNQERYFVFVARMAEDKDHLTVIHAFNLFHKLHPNAKMYFLGDGYKRGEYERLVSSLGLNKHIIFVGTVTNPFGYMQNAVANILSSPSEGLASVLVEAACLKTLNIASDCPNGPSEILLNGEAGLLFPVGNPKKLFEKMLIAWNQEDNVSRMISVAYNNLHRFESDKIISQINSLIDNVLSEHGKQKT